jgi:(p)ppGpp synthase/HD superfamily hydrolase
MVEDFGKRVADIVQSLTDEPLPEELTWDEKHQKYLENLKNSSHEAVLVCLADKFANVSTSPVNQDRIWYYQGVIEIAKERKLTQSIKLLKDFEDFTK